MKKVLIISKNHNEKESSGSNRIRGLSKYLSIFGWEPFVLTIDIETSEEFPYKVYKTDYYNRIDEWKKRLGMNANSSVKNQIKSIKYEKNNRYFQFLFTAWQDIFCYPDEYKKGWYSNAINEGNKIIEENAIDVILSSSPPPTCHIIALKLSQKHNLPWIADYRDLWTQYHYYPYSSIRRFIDTKLERRLLSNTTAVTVVSEFFTQELKKFIFNKKIYTIENGFDPLISNKSEELSNKFNIVYTGSLYQGKRDPEKFFIALKELIEEKKIDAKKLRIDFYGNNQDFLIKDIKKYNLAEHVILHGPVSKEECIKHQKKAQVLLLQTMNDPRDAGVIPGKLFDYFAAQRPILSVGYKDSIIKKILTKTMAGVHVSEVSEIKSLIEQLYKEYIYQKNISYNGIESEINRYSHKQMALKMVKVLNEIV